LDDNLEQILAINPGRVIFGGDNTYADTYESLFGDNWDNWLTDDQSTNKLFAIPGNHDYDAEADLDAFKAFFAGNKGENKRYYAFVYGPFHFFMLDTDPRAEGLDYVDATTSVEDGEMMEWLRVQLAVSTAKYKIVVGHHGPYMSDTNYTPGNRWLRCPYKEWGADLYIGFHGHNFEHVEVDEFNYITAGIGGHSLRAFGANTSGTIHKQYNSNYGFLKLTGNCDSLTIALIDRDGTEQYSFEYTN
jgi:hypothetical protein